MKTHVLFSGPRGGLAEARIAYRQRWKKSLPGLQALDGQDRIVLCDASTIVPNCRPSELLVALMAMVQIPQNVDILTFITQSGTICEFASEWTNPETLVPGRIGNWRDFYAGKIPYMDRIPKEFAPIAVFGLGKGNMSFPNFVVVKRHQRLLGLWDSLVPYLGLGSCFFQRLSVDVFGKGFEVSLSEISKNLEPGQALGCFPCPDCSYQKRKPIYHHFRMLREGFDVTPERSKRVLRCKGARAFLEGVGDNIMLSSLIEISGFIPGGLATYESLRRWNGLGMPGIMIRDYSNARGTLGRIVREWPHANLWITTRFYMKRESDGKEASFKEFEASLRAEPAAWAEFIRETPLISNGDCMTVLI